MEQGQVFCIMNESLFQVPRIQNDHGLSSIKEMYTIADTPEELAAALGIDPEGLRATLEQYGEYVRSGVDEEFGKAASALTSDFSEGPYYGVKAVTENHTVYGGIKTDNSARVLRADGSIIPGLYAAGEVALFKTAGRSPLPESIDMGRVAVGNAIETVISVQ